MILVFGATGTLGSALRRVGAARSLPMRSAARRGADFEIDITDDAAVQALIRREKPDAIINCAAITDLDACEKSPTLAMRSNGHAPGVMARTATNIGAAFVQISTDHFFTGDGGRLHDEAAPVTLVNEYARSKFAGEEAALAESGALVVRTNLTGWRGWAGRPTFVEWAVGALLKDQQIVTGFSDFITSTIDADTLAAAIFDAMARRALGRLNIAAREAADKATFLRALAVALNVSPSRIGEGSVRALKTPRAESLGLDVRRAESLLGYRLPGINAVIAALVKSRPSEPCAS